MLTTMRKATYQSSMSKALRSIRRIVLTIKERIAAGQASNPGDGYQRLSAGDPSSSEAARSNRGEDRDGQKR